VKNNSLQHILELNLATLFIASSAIFGKLITINPIATIFYRCVLASLFLYLIAKLSKTNLKFDALRHWRFLISGAVLLSAHWITYYMSIRAAGVAVAMLSLFTYPIITTLLEPFYFKSRFSKFNLLCSVAIIIGVALIIPDFDLDNPITLGVGFGIISAFLFSFRNLISKKYVEIYPSTNIIFYQLSVASILLFPFVLVQGVIPQEKDIYLLLGVSLIATAFGHTLFMRGLKNFSTSTASIISSIQPVYGIALAVLITGERNKTIVFLGGAIILSVVILQSIRQTLKPV